MVVWLGGAPHDWPSAREFNLYQDVRASQVLFDSGVPLMQIPTTNVAEHLRTTEPKSTKITCLPTALSGTLAGVWQNVHLVTRGMLLALSVNRPLAWPRLAATPQGCVAGCRHGHVPSR